MNFLIILQAQSQWKEAIEDFKLENEFLTVTFSSKTGSIASITNKANGQTLQINQEYLWYNGSAGNNNGIFSFFKIYSFSKYFFIFFC